MARPPIINYQGVLFQRQLVDALDYVEGLSGRILRVAFHSDATANITLTNQANSLAFLNSAPRVINMVDLTGFTQYRLMVRVLTASASANNPRIFLRYKSGAFSDVGGDFSEIGTSAEIVSLAATGLIATPWTGLVSGAIADGIYIAVMQHGGDGAADPVLGNVHVEFK